LTEKFCFDDENKSKKQKLINECQKVEYCRRNKLPYKNDEIADRVNDVLNEIMNDITVFEHQGKQEK
jgi:uncharacterized lipoprotein YajG